MLSLNPKSDTPRFSDIKGGILGLEVPMTDTLSMYVFLAILFRCLAI